ncbi:hypothetical protein NA78x_001229 [Anatilimnocola sp. NA78]|uniref:hypothetical protein n=1 Tax=Anatilimnocola sp. NA78 TaxID=3415683 RepID=UPI003CE454F8
MLCSRRTVLGSIAATLAAGLLPVSSSLRAAEEPKRKRIAVVTTVWKDRSHAWHMAERFLHGYPKKGAWYRPPIDVVSAYVDQKPSGDLSAGRAKEFGFTIYPTVAEALRCGGNDLAVDGVLIIGEHGNYEKSQYEQTKYPRYEFFKQVVEVFRQSGRVLPVFNDKHLSWNWDWAKEMYDTSQEMKIPFAAGSSLPVTWRMPSVELPIDSEVEELLCLAYGSIDSYDFHALEVIQCLAERRKGGETGVAAVQALRGDAVWQALAAKDWNAGGWDPRLFEACLSRTQTLAQPATFSHRYPTVAQMKEWVKQPVAYRIEYRDGTKATMLLMNGLVTDFNIAVKLKGKPEPFSTLFYLPPTPNVTYSASLMSKAEETFLTGQAPCPIERTLITTGLVEAGVRSLGKEQARLETPHLAISYRAPRESQFLRD